MNHAFTDDYVSIRVSAPAPVPATPHGLAFAYYAGDDDIPDQDGLTDAYAFACWQADEIADRDD